MMEIKGNHGNQNNSALHERVCTHEVVWVPFELVRNIGDMSRISTLMMSIGGIFLGTSIGLFVGEYLEAGLLMIVPAVLFMSLGHLCNSVFVGRQIENVMSKSAPGMVVMENEPRKWV